MSLDPNKTYLVWNGTEFPNSTRAQFKAPAGSTIDWGDGESTEFSTETAATHTYDDGKTEHTIVISGLTSIGNYAFRECRSLTSVTIGNSVTSIGASAFSHCSSLKQLILFPSTPPTLGSEAIPTTISKIYVQQSSKTAYQAATNWTTFASKIVSDNIYLSFVRFNQKNKEYIEKKINDNWNDLNLENGTGLDSLVQKYSGEVDATHFGNTCDGESGAVFGEANFNSGNRALISGKMNRSSAPNSLIVGLGNGRGIDADPTIDVLSGEQLFVFGALNQISNGNGNAVLGAENTLSDVRYTTIIGRGNIIDNTSLYEGKCVVGRFNNQKPNTMFEVGVGDYNNRVNGFEVYKDGRAKVQSAPIDNDDVVRKLELDNVNAGYVSTSILGG